MCLCESTYWLSSPAQGNHDILAGRLCLSRLWRTCGSLDGISCMRRMSPASWVWASDRRMTKYGDLIIRYWAQDGPACRRTMHSKSDIRCAMCSTAVRALVYDRYAEENDFASILDIKDIDEPEPGPREVCFRVRAAALNHDDIWGMRGKPIGVPMPHISGSDAAGDVTAVGSQVEGLKVGDRIVSHGNISCRICRMCTSGREYDCKNRIVWGFQTGPLWGGFCEVSHLPEINAVPIPDGVSYEEAAASSMTMMTSWHMLVGRARIVPGQSVLIMGGGSGMGIFGIQIAKMFGCTVIATAGPGKLEQCIELGADHAIDHRRDDWDSRVKEIAGSGLDVIFEHIGGEHWNRELALLRRGGTVVTTGATTGYDVRTNLNRLTSEGLSILGSTQGTRAELEQCLYWLSRGDIRAVIDSEYPLERAAEAHQRMLRGKGLFGKILLKP
ncbi:Zn-dependent oxidoreductase [Cenarchaeum symbiosum A]|uniref:Zn-dependent oxidoreductase n=1 Tax=Cenarchaeum symbiosum (strain A) TaxID=414004 RepID=A0RZ53_CENSY|nr:Zn-dependent oxidoreductase [Cenarchaeum symbiosum A]